MSRNAMRLATVVAVILALALAGASVAKGPPSGGETAVNNLSFPAIAVDGFAITPLTQPSFETTYTGDYAGLTATEIEALEASGPWYPQKLAENKWQADFENGGPVDVTYIDWSDNMESVSPKVRSSFRIEMVLFKALDIPMTAYTMAVLENPSSPDELQGTNMTTYESAYATVISAKPQLVVQYLGTSVPTDLAWSSDHWVMADTTPSVVPVGFAPELNVGGKYIFGASTGGWKPDTAGYYRITFYVPTSSGVNLLSGSIANAATGFTAPTEGVATAVVGWPDPLTETTYNLTYIDVLAKGGGGGGGGRR